MTQTKRIGKGAGTGAIILALIFLINPTVKVVDILPDFIACFILAKKLGYAADRTPYFEEARISFIRLALVSLAKIPSFFIISYAKAHNVQDYDTAVLFTLVFTVIEVILLISAVKNLFLGAFYLGERTDAVALLSPFKLNKSGTRQMTPESLKMLTYVFIGVKSALCLFPEMLLLTRSVDPGAYLQVFRPMKYYPYTIVLAVIAVFVFSIIYAKRAKAYIRAIHVDGHFTSAVDSMIGEERAEELSRKCKLKSINRTLSILTVASVFTVELCFDNFYGANIIPHFIYASLLLAALVSMRHHTKIPKAAYPLSGVYCALAIAAYVVQITFIDRFGYDSLVKGAAAKEAYLPVIILSILEFLALTALSVFVILAMRRLVIAHTAIEPTSERYSSADAQHHKKRSRQAVIWGVLGIVAGLSKVLDVALKYSSNLTLVATGDGIGNVVTGLIPWFNLVVLLCSAIYIGYSLYLFSSLKEDCELKYI